MLFGRWRTRGVLAAFGKEEEQKDEDKEAQQGGGLAKGGGGLRRAEGRYQAAESCVLGTAAKAGERWPLVLRTVNPVWFEEERVAAAA